MASEFKAINFLHILRENNSHADRLANQGVDLKCRSLLCDQQDQERKLDSFIANHIICMLCFCIILLGQFIRSFSSHRIGIGDDKEKLKKEAQGGVNLFLLWEKTVSRLL